MLRDDFSIAEHQEEATCDSGYKLTLTRFGNKTVLNQVGLAQTAIYTKSVISSIDSCVPHFTLSVEQQAIIPKQILVRTPTELRWVRYVQRTVFMENVNTESVWIYKLESQQVANVPVWNIVGYQRRDKQKLQVR